MIRNSILVLITALSISFSSCSHVAEVADEQGNRIDLEIQEIEQVELPDSSQWIFSSGEDADNPVILYLDGGPGGSEIGAVRRYLGPLHQYATVVCWDQRGTGKSYGVSDDLSLEAFVGDTIEISEYLREKYGKERIYLLGHSWGSVIGVLAAQRRPDLYAAYIGAGQHINSIENDAVGWHMVHDGALREGDHKLAEKLESYGLPPFLQELPDGRKVPDGDAYYGLLKELYHYSPKAPNDHRFDSMTMFFAPEHSFFDTVNIARGLVRGVKEVYPQLAFTDIEQEVPSLEVPLYIINGAYDRTCVAEITDRWFEGVSAPYKQMLYLPDSGHNGIFTDSERVIEFFRSEVLMKDPES